MYKPITCRNYIKKGKSSKIGTEHIDGRSELALELSMLVISKICSRFSEVSRGGTSENLRGLWQQVSWFADCDTPWVVSPIDFVLFTFYIF